jgi:hypothetical protein
MTAPVVPVEPVEVCSLCGTPFHFVDYSIDDGLLLNRYRCVTEGCTEIADFYAL